MKKVVFLYISWLFFINPVKLSGQPLTPYQEGVLQAPVAMGTSQPVTIVPNTQPICFDKQLSVEMSFNSRVVEQCIYLNTTDGLIGHLKPQNTNSHLCDIFPNLEDFSFFIFGLKGNTYHYFNQKPKEEIIHYVSTSNSDTYLYQFTPPTGSLVLHLQPESRMYCNNKIKARAYKFDGGTQTWYVFGREFPETLTWENYFGNLGVGYLKTDRGLFLLMEMDINNNYFKITSLEKVNTCFDPRPFHVIEDQFYTKRHEELEEQREKLNEEYEHISEGHCVQEKTDLFDFHLEELNKQEQNLENSMVGNSMQNVQTQKAILGMSDPIDMVREAILQTKQSICEEQEYIITHPGPEGSPAAEKRNCLLGVLHEEELCLTAMEQLDVQYASNLAMAYAYKNKRYWDLLSSIDNCE